MIKNTLHRENTELEQTHREQIKVLNGMLTETIDIASVDFLQMITVLTKYDAGTGSEHVSLAVKELQHIDTLRQKLQHIIEFQQEILNNENPYHEYCEDLNIQDVIGPLLKLNYFQLVAAQDDLDKVVHKVQNLMYKIKSDLPQHSNHEISLASFKNLHKINDNFRNITASLNFLTTKYYSSSDLNLSQIADYFSDRYSMKSERIVLNWCVSSEYESDEDFKRYYGSHDQSESIELF